MLDIRKGREEGGREKKKKGKERGRKEWREEGGNKA